MVSVCEVTAPVFGSGADVELVVSDEVPSEFVVVELVVDEPSVLVTVSD